MPVIDDGTIPANASLLRVLVPEWITNKGGTRRAASLAFLSTEQEVSYFIEAEGILAEVQRIFPGHEIARVPVAVMRGAGLAIERRPDECPAEFHGDHTCHVIGGPNADVTRNEFERRARLVAKHQDVTIIPPPALEATP